MILSRREALSVGPTRYGSPDCAFY